MMDIEAFSAAADALTAAMPAELFRDLNGGITIDEGAKTEDGAPVLGDYGRDRVLGRWIVLYYDSFARLLPEAEDQTVIARLEAELRRLLRRHMLEQAGIYEE